MSLAEDIRTVRWWKSSFFVVLRRMLALGTTWALLGALIGANCEALARGNRIGVLASVIAWTIVMAIAGSFMALFGGRPKGALIGAGFGLLIAMSVGRLSGIDEHMQMNMGALLGAIVAATLYPWIKMYMFLISQLWRLAQSPVDA